MGIRDSHRWLLIGLAAAAMACSGDQLEEAGSPASPPPATDFVALAGHWSPGEDAGQRTITGDATQWDGEPRPDARTAATRLFGPPSPELMANLGAPGAFPIAISTTVPSFQGGTLSVDFNLIGGETDQIAGLVFNLRPTGEYYYVRYNTRDDDIALWRFADGERENLLHGEGMRRLEFDTWYPLSLTVDGQQLTAEVDGDLTLEYTLDTPVDGRVGVWTKRDSITSFKNLQVR